MSPVKTPLPSLVLLNEPSLMEQLTSSRDSVDLASKHISKKVCEWFESWRPWQQRMLICGLTDRCSKTQLETLATSLEPVFHRDFVTNARQRYPSAPFRHMKKRMEEKERVAEQKRLAQIFQDEYHKRFPDSIPCLDESDMEFFNRLIPSSFNCGLDEFGEQLSARIIVGAVNTLRSDPRLWEKTESTFPSEPESMEVNATPKSGPEETENTGSARDFEKLSKTTVTFDPETLESSGQNLHSGDEVVTKSGVNQTQNILIIDESPPDSAEGDFLSPPDTSTGAQPDRKLSRITEEGLELSPGGGNEASLVEGVEALPKEGDTAEANPETEVNDAPSSQASTGTNAPSPKPETIVDPLKRRKPKKKKKKDLPPILDMPPLKHIEHRHRSAPGSGSDVGTVDFFLNKHSEKLGFMQRQISKGTNKANSFEHVLLPLQKCYKHEKFCSQDRTYVRAHRGKLRSQFRRQVNQVWTWISVWKDYERLALLSDITKLCDVQLIEYLCHCLTMRLRGRVDIDSLQDSMLLKVFEYLDYENINTASRVCSRWRYICNLDQLWQRKCKQIGKSQGLPNINHIILRTRKKSKQSKQVDWKLAYLKILKLSNETKTAQPRPRRLDCEESTPRGMQRVNGKFLPTSIQDETTCEEKTKPSRLTVSTNLLTKPRTIFYVRDQGLDVIEDDDDSESYVDVNEYSNYYDDDDKSKKIRRRQQRSDSVYGSSFDVSGRTRYEPSKELVSDEEEGAEDKSGNKPTRRKKKRNTEEEPAMDVRPELRQARDLLNAYAPSRSLIWKEPHKPELKQKAARFAGEVKTVQRVRKLQGHLDSVLCIAVSKYRMISGSMDRSIRIWELNSGKSLHKLYGHMGGVRCLHFEGALLVSGSWDMQVMIWDLVKFTRLSVLTGHRGSVSAVQFNDTYIVSASHDKTVRVYFRDGFDLVRIIKGHSDAISSMKIDSINVITASSDQTVRITNLESGHCQKIFNLPEHVVSVCVQNDLIITGNGIGQCHFLNKHTGCVEAGVNVHRGSVNQVLIHKNRFFTCSNDSTVREWDLVTMTCVRYLQGPRGAIRDLKVDDKRIISCGDDGIIRVWDICPPANERGSPHGDIIPSTVVKAKV